MNAVVSGIPAPQAFRLSNQLLHKQLRVRVRAHFSHYNLSFSSFHFSLISFLLLNFVFKYTEPNSSFMINTTTRQHVGSARTRECRPLGNQSRRV